MTTVPPHKTRIEVPMIKLSKIPSTAPVSRKSWADRQGILTGVEGEFHGGVWIEEKNRATVYEYRRAGIETLRDICLQYRRKKVKAVLFGTPSPNGQPRYAVYVQSGFLRDVGEDD